MFKFSVASVCCIASSVAAQSASISLQAASDSAAPGDTVTVSLVADFTLGESSSGVFGAAGLYGFGGNAVVSGDASTGIQGASPLVETAFDFGQTAAIQPENAQLFRAAGGRGFDGGIASGPTTLASFDVVLGADASGELVIDYDGAVVLVQGNSLVTYSTDPGVNQSSLSVSPLTITVDTSSLCADVNGDGELGADDFNAWLNAFINNDLKADINGNGELGADDFNSWLTAFIAGPTGPTCP